MTFTLFEVIGIILLTSSITVGIQVIWNTIMFYYNDYKWDKIFESPEFEEFITKRSEEAKENHKKGKYWTTEQSKISMELDRKDKDEWKRMVFSYNKMRDEMAKKANENQRNRSRNRWKSSEV